jgi:hypothetical protein
MPKAGASVASIVGSKLDLAKTREVSKRNGTRHGFYRAERGESWLVFATVPTLAAASRSFKLARFGFLASAIVDAVPNTFRAASSLEFVRFSTP